MLSVSGNDYMISLGDGDFLQGGNGEDVYLIFNIAPTTLFIDNYSNNIVSDSLIYFMFDVINLEKLLLRRLSSPNVVVLNFFLSEKFRHLNVYIGDRKFSSSTLLRHGNDEDLGTCLSHQELFRVEW